MKVYDLIKELTQYPADSDVIIKVGNLETDDIEFNEKGYGNSSTVFIKV